MPMRIGRRGWFEVTFSEDYSRLDSTQIGKREPVFIPQARDKLTQLITEMCRFQVALRECPIAGEASELPATEVYRKALRLVFLLWENCEDCIVRLEKLKELGIREGEEKRA